ncbi:MAG: hypothetical protein JXR83_01160, partial [Deltaproteobacteria bacterium]|nr:hypothetical protein [Deltaproteobacteria bacterium]
MATVQASACFHPRSCLTAGATVLAISIAIGGCPPSPPATICRDDSDCPAGRCDPNGHYCYLDDVGRDGAIADVGADGDALASDGGLDAAFDATATDAACHRFGPVVQIAAAASATCVRNAIGEVKCWGGNAYGELGLGDTLKRGDSTVEMGCHLPTVDLGGHQATAIAAGFNHFCALLEDGSLRCWGKNRYGQLGLGDTMSRGAEPQHMGNALPAVPLGIDAGIAQIAAGGDHTCVLFDNRVIKCWGLNIHGQLGLGDTYNRGDGIYDGGCDAGGPDAAVDCEMGTRLSAARILADAGSGADAGATRILAGANHSCAVLVDGHIKCWGYNGNGLLGLGDTFSRADQSNELEEHLPNVQMEES